jgi:hypothetical protein
MQYSISIVTQTVGVMTEYSYIYGTMTRFSTAYKTATFLAVTTSRSYSTATRTTTGYATTRTLSTTTTETSLTTENRVSHGTATSTQYVYVESYPRPTNITNTTTVSQTEPLLALPLGALTKYALLLTLTPVGGLAVYLGARTLRKRRTLPTEGEVVKPQPEKMELPEKKLLEYIMSHGGSLSLSKAAEELGVPMDVLTQTLNSLKKGGKLRSM